jgi:hypothetical protein
VLLALVLGACLLGSVGPAGAVKWTHCPSDITYYPSVIGAVSSPFVHPGHEIGIFLSDKEMQRSGAFSTDPGGNLVSITFASLFGPRIKLPSTTAAAVSPSTLYFNFPDTQAIVGRPLAGPVEIVVTTGGRTTADIDPRDLVALPSATDVGRLASGAIQQNVLATMDSRGAIWIPVQFGSFGTMEKPMPMCPGQFAPIVALTVGVSVRSIPSSVLPGAPPTYPPFRVLHKVNLYLGDFLANGVNHYGERMSDMAVTRVPRGWGIRVCGKNDALDVVVRAPGWRRWTKAWSPFRAWMPSSQPMSVALSNVFADPSLSVSGLDAFGAECQLQ